MSYQICSDCKRVALYVLVGADESLVGLEFQTCRIISMPYVELANIVIQLYGREALLHFTTTIAEGQIIPNNSDLIVLEVREYSGGQIDFCDKYVFTLLKLYKAEDVYPCYRIIYSSKNETLTSQGFVHEIKYKHAIAFREARYHLNEAEKVSFPLWLDSCINNLFMIPQNTQFENILRTYDTSYLLGHTGLEFVMLFTALEMTLADGRSEKVFKLSKGTALLLTDNENERRLLEKQVKKLYNIRSRYVHNGKNVGLCDLYELRNIVRRVIIRLIELGFCKEEASLRTLRQQLFSKKNFATQEATDNT